MKRIIIVWTILEILLACHYSCFNCTGSLYTSCISCPASALTVVENPNVIPQVYWSSVYPTGTCVDTLGGKTNPLGIVLFIVLSAMLLMGGSKEGLYLYLTIQTWGLFNLVEIAWVNPIGYILQAFQYFMIWNVLGSGYKSVNFTFLTNKYYRMNIYLQQPGLAQNIVLIAAFTLLAMVLLIIICIIAVRRKKQT